MKLFEITQKLVFIRGNMEYAAAKNQTDELLEFYDKIINIMEKYSTVTVVDSDIKSDKIPDAVVYVAHSRGCGYQEFFKDVPFFCLDDYENCPETDIVIGKDTPIEERPPLEPCHFTLNKKMKVKLNKFLSKHYANT